eukprot:TRINITY_DN3191_c0_g2_i1.p1 TRINITY_DN3191_c0_g2~~TRINITY_DN3191_c0_g2_i1.p1  ORF type:complete len:646 (+),score=170.77 TRINITY_DN3191_c0_g2_i1:100-2037(+)
MTRTLALLCMAATAAGHATMIQPMSRAYMKKMKGGLDGKPCISGSCTEPWSAGGPGGFSPCGIPKGLGTDTHDYTTDPWSLSRLSQQEAQMSTLQPGGVLEIKVLATAHHMGHFIFGLCPDASMTGTAYGTPPTAVPDCSTLSDPTLKAACDAGYMSPLDTYGPAQKLMDCFLGKGAWANGKDGAGLLKRSEAHEHRDPAPIDADFPERWYLPPDSYTLQTSSGEKTGGGWPVTEQKGVFTMYYKIPSNLKCTGGRCLLHFFYWTANSCTGKGYNKYFVNSHQTYGKQPRSACTGGQCTNGHVDAVPVGSWAMSGDWWTGPHYDAHGSCDSRVDDSPTNVWSRLNPERFWNCGDVQVGTASPPSGGTPPPASPPCHCEPRACQVGTCTNGQCLWADGSDDTLCPACGACRQSACGSGACRCDPKTDGTQCSGGTCSAGTCVPSPPSGPAPVDCVASVTCSWGTCTVDCGGGTRTKTCTRQVTSEAQHGGKSCAEVAPMPPRESEPCNTNDCPTNGKTCLDPAAEAWGACTPAKQGDPPKCCPKGYVCCGNEWWASCRQTCSSSETSFAASKDGDSSGGGMSSTLTAILGLLAGLGLGGVATVFMMRRGRSSEASQNAGVEEQGTTSRGAASTSRVKGSYKQQADI